MEKEDLKKSEDIIREAVSSLLEKMNIENELEINLVSQEEGRDNFLCNIKTRESNYLIGQYGVNLQALQHIARVMTRKKNEGSFNFILDVNSYRHEKDASILVLAREMAQKALDEKRAVVLRPMSSYERRLVHLELSQNDQVKTESVGDGEDRRVSISPVGIV